MFATKLKEHDEKLLKQGIGTSIKRMRQKGLSDAKIAELLDMPIEDVGKV